MTTVLIWAALILSGLLAWLSVGTLVAVIFGEAIKNAEELRRRREAP